MIGADSNSAIQPSRKQPDRRDRSRRPSPRGSRPGRRSGCRRPTANPPTPAANSGAIVESAPTDIWRAGAQQREHHGAGGERVEAGDRGHPGQPGGRELLGHRDHEQASTAATRSRRQPLTPVAPKCGSEGGCRRGAWLDWGVLGLQSRCRRARGRERPWVVVMSADDEHHGGESDHQPPAGVGGLREIASGDRTGAGADDRA